MGEIDSSSLQAKLLWGISQTKGCSSTRSTGVIALIFITKRGSAPSPYSTTWVRVSKSICVLRENSLYDLPIGR